MIISLADRLSNFVSRLGTDRDKASSLAYGATVLSDDEVLNAYRTAWLPRKIVDIPAFDSTRRWRSWQASNEQIEAIEAEEKRLGLRAKVYQARTTARLLGGAAILIGTGEPDLREPLDLERVAKGGLRYLTVFNRSQLTGGEPNLDPATEWYGRPGLYSLQGQDGRQIDIHPSRLAIFQGNSVPDDRVQPAHRGWGESVLQCVMEAVKNADGTAANVASLVYEAKVDVILVPNMMSQIGDESYKKRLLERFTLAATAKGINGTLLLDKEEDYQSKSASFTQLPEVVRTFMELAAGAADIPLTRLLGTSPGGLNATGESDIRNYYDRVSAMQEIEMTPAMMRLDECLIRSALGARDPSIHYVWSSLWQISDKERAEIGKANADAAKTLADTGLIPPPALAKAVVSQFVEQAIYPGLEDAVEEAGGLDAVQPEPNPDLESERATGGRVVPLRRAANDAAPRTLYVRRDVLNAAEIIAWAQGQGFETTLPADDLHVTIAFSRTPLDWMKVGESWSFGDGKGNLTINPGGPRMMERFGEAVVLLFSSSDLQWRHMAIREAGASWDHEEYQPHVTITYKPGSVDLSKVEPYRGKIVLGPEIFEEVAEGWQERVSEE